MPAVSMKQLMIKLSAAMEISSIKTAKILKTGEEKLYKKCLSEHSYVLDHLRRFLVIPTSLICISNSFHDFFQILTVQLMPVMGKKL